jgi:hypothetical protein
MPVSRYESRPYVRGFKPFFARGGLRRERKVSSKSPRSVRRDAFGGFWYLPNRVWSIRHVPSPNRSPGFCCTCCERVRPSEHFLRRHHLALHEGHLCLYPILDNTPRGPYRLQLPLTLPATLTGVVVEIALFPFCQNCVDGLPIARASAHYSGRFRGTRRRSQ